MNKFEGQFMLGPEVAITWEPKSFPGKNVYKVCVFNILQAEAIFFETNPNLVKVYAIREDIMTVKFVSNVYEAKEFFLAPAPT